MLTQRTYPLALSFLETLLGLGPLVGADYSRGRSPATTSGRLGLAPFIFLQRSFQRPPPLCLSFLVLELGLALRLLLPRGRSVSRARELSIGYALLDNSALDDASLEFKGATRAKVVV